MDVGEQGGEVAGCFGFGDVDGGYILEDSAVIAQTHVEDCLSCW